VYTSLPHYIAGLNQVQGIYASKYAMEKKCILKAVKLMKRYPVNCLCGNFLFCKNDQGA
jgi:hypothetical protein